MSNEKEIKKVEEEFAPITDDALASFNNEFSELQEKYKLKVLGIPLITPDGRIVVSIQALPLVKKEEKEEKHEHDTPIESPYKD